MRRALGADADEETVAKALALYKPYYAPRIARSRRSPTRAFGADGGAQSGGSFRLAVVSNKPDEAVRPLVAKALRRAADIAMGETAQPAATPDMVNDARSRLGATSPARPTSATARWTSRRRGTRHPCISVTWGFRDREQLVEAKATELAADAGELHALLEK